MTVTAPVSAPAQTITEATIIGAGPTGLACAVMLAKRGVKKINIYERLGKYARADDATTWENARSYIVGPQLIYCHIFNSLIYITKVSMEEVKAY